MKNFKIKNNGTAEIKSGCQWMYIDYECCGTINPDGGAIINGKFFCDIHFNSFKNIDRQFKILEEIEVEI